MKILLLKKDNKKIIEEVGNKNVATGNWKFFEYD